MVVGVKKMKLMYKRRMRRLAVAEAAFQLREREIKRRGTNDTLTV